MGHRANTAFAVASNEQSGPKTPGTWSSGQYLRVIIQIKPASFMQCFSKRFFRKKMMKSFGVRASKL